MITAVRVTAHFQEQFQSQLKPFHYELDIECLRNLLVCIETALSHHRTHFKCVICFDVFICWTYMLYGFVFIS